LKYQSKAAEYGTDGVRGIDRLRNQIEQKKAHDQEDDELLDPPHIGLLIFRSSPQSIRMGCRMYRLSRGSTRLWTTLCGGQHQHCGLVAALVVLRLAAALTVRRRD
jgi:hypothetical protein